MGGGATRAYNVAKGIVANSCRVTVVAAFPHYPTGNIPEKYRWKLLSIEDENGVRVIRTFVPPLASEGFAKRVLLFLSFLASSLFVLPFAGNVDVVWAANPSIIAMYPAFIYSLVKSCPIVQNVDDLWPESLYDLGMAKNSLQAKLSETIAHVAYRLSSIITPISPAYVQVLVNKYGVEPQKIQVVPAGVDLSRFSPTSETVIRDDGRFRALYIGAFSLAYDFDQVFRAAKLLGSYPDVEFLIQGGGELAQILKSKVKEMNLQNVSVVDRIVSRQEVAKLLCDADALLLPLSGLTSIELGISSKLYEYQAAGKPILCCSSGMPGRYVSETGSGITISPGDHEALARAILFLRDNPDGAQRLGASGKQFVENNVSVERVGLGMKRVFGCVVK